MTCLLLKETFMFGLILSISLSLYSSGQAAAVGNFQVASRMSHEQACIQVYKNVAYSLWKHLCGIQSAGKREDMEQQTIQRADSQPQGECMDEKDKERQRDLELIQLLLDDSPDQQRNVMENDEVY